MTTEILRYQINQLIKENAVKFPVGSVMYHSNKMKTHGPYPWAQYFGPVESAMHYVQDHPDYVLHQFHCTREVVLLNFSTNQRHSTQIDRLYQLIQTLIQLLQFPSTDKETSQTIGRRLTASMDVIRLFTHLAYGLSIPYNVEEIDYLVMDLASSLTYPKQYLKSDLTKQILKIAHSGQCQSSRISFVDYDRLLCNALTYVIEACQLPIDGIYFQADSPTSPCCRLVNQLKSNIETCVPTEYTFFRAKNVVVYDGISKKLNTPFSNR